MPIPHLFKERYCSLVEDEEKFLESLSIHQPKSFRVNTIKTSKKTVEERFTQYGFQLRNVVWYVDAYITTNLEISETIEHLTGHIYIQELTSMIPPLLVQNELKNAPLVIDACAAPGSKTTHLAALMENKNTIIANDVDASRVSVLRSTVERLGVVNTIITKNDFRSFPLFQADVVLLDAPCSAEGTMRDHPDALTLWSLDRIERFAALQKQLILRAFDSTKPDGVLLYSTCTFAPEENEAVVNYLLEKREDAELKQITRDTFQFSPALNSWNKQTFDPQIRNAVRIWPHISNTGGFFIAKVKKHD